MPMLILDDDEKAVGESIETSRRTPFFLCPPDLKLLSLVWPFAIHFDFRRATSARSFVVTSRPRRLYS